MILRFWDMDHTLLDNDCDVSWKLFLIEKGIAPREDLERIVHFWEQYEEGRLDPVSFNEFQLREFAGRTETEIAELSREHFETIARPKVYAEAMELVQGQRASGDHTCMITATNIAIACSAAQQSYGAPMRQSPSGTSVRRIMGARRPLAHSSNFSASPKGSACRVREPSATVTVTPSL